MDKKSVYYVLSTHWDREWYQSFQNFRYQLVQLVDKTMDALKSGELCGPFYADGQAGIADDYLEIRPERRTEFEQLVQRGAIRLGPWYVQPDEFLVSGESLIRNLRLGSQTAAALGGEPSRAGFVCDMFGHTSQLPQIFNGFGMTNAFLWRGVNLHGKRQFIWQGADGSALTVYRCGGEGYGDFSRCVREASKCGKPVDAQEKRRLLDEFIERETACSEVDSVLLFDGGDHLEFSPDLYAVVREKIDSGEVRHVDLDGYMTAMQSQRSRISETRTGELREPGIEEDGCSDTTELIQGVLSSRVWIKQRNAVCETLLTRWAEPFSLFAGQVLGTDYPQGFLNAAWKWLIKNHFHDAICGCSIDAVHRDMQFRFAQAEQIAERLADEAAKNISAHIEGDLGEKEFRVTLFNPDVQPFKGTTELTLRIPQDWPEFGEFFGYEMKPSFRMFGADGTEIAYQRIQQAPGRIARRLRREHWPEAWKVTDVTVSLPLTIPACGYTTLKVCAGQKEQNRGRRQAERTRHPEHRGLRVGTTAMQNENLRVELLPNGTLKLTDLNSGVVYENLLMVEDTADIGDGWYHGAAVNDQTFLSSACAADVALIHNGPYLTTFRVRTLMRVPEQFDFSTMCRSDSVQEMKIESLVSLRPGADSVSVRTRIVNPVKDHRVRVLFPSGCADATTYLADSSFDVVERAIALREDRHLIKELDVETRPQQSWTAVNTKRRGLAVISKGILESAVCDLEDRPLALTLFRSTRRTVMTDGEPEGQLLDRELMFDYRIRPLSGDPDRAALFAKGRSLAAGLRSVQMHQADLEFRRTTATLPPEAGFLNVAGSVVVTAIQQTGRGMELRLFNPNLKEVAVTVCFGEHWQPSTVQAVNLESEPLGEEQRIDGPSYELTIKPKQIVTLCFTSQMIQKKP
jgi:alpha-mannosidase/mannosylglycerate hydrolase